MHATNPSRWKIVLAFGLVYLFWGSTYLGIDIAVQSIPPGLMCAVRFSIAGVVMLFVCALTGRRIWYSPQMIARSSVVGILLLMGGNLTLSYAELSVSTGLAALIVAITPLWFLVLDSMLLGHHRIALRGKAGLALGVVGLLVLFYPELTSTTALGRKELWASLSLIGGSFSWALGSVLSKRWQSAMDPFSSTGWQVTAAGVANFVFAVLVEDLHRAVWTTRGIAADRISCRLRLLDRLHRLHLAAGACSHVQGLDLCLCESGGRGLPGMARSARARQQIYSRGERGGGPFGDSCEPAPK